MSVRRTVAFAVLIALALSSPRAVEGLSPVVGQILRSSSRGSPQEHNFTNKGTGEIRDEDGTVFAFTSYEDTSDGASLMVLHKRYASVAEARRKFEHEIQKATKILERSAKKDKTGKVVEERGVLVCRSAEQGGSAQMILWINGLDLFEVLSDSLKDARELENKLKH
jgi:hypothetical protein